MYELTTEKLQVVNHFLAEDCPELDAWLLPVDGAVCLEEGVVGLGIVGSGQVRSLDSVDVQNGLILSYRYHYL